MVVFPPAFVATRFPGYFWNTEDQQLYSAKTGVLQPIKFRKGGVFGHIVVEPGYPISVNGIRRSLSLAYLRALRPTVDNQVIPVKST